MIRLQDAWSRTAGVRGHKPWRTVWMRVWSMEHGQTIRRVSHMPCNDAEGTESSR